MTPRAPRGGHTALIIMRTSRSACTWTRGSLKLSSEIPYEVLNLIAYAGSQILTRTARDPRYDKLYAMCLRADITRPAITLRAPVQNSVL